MTRGAHGLLINLLLTHNKKFLLSHHRPPAKACMQLTASPTEKIHFRDYDIYVKRDDLLHPEFSGNKARKFLFALQQDFPNINKVIGHGSAQANSLYSLSALAKLKGWQLDFYVDHIASWLKENPSGNYQAALANGANIIAVNDIAANIEVTDYINRYVLPSEHQALFLPEGGRCKEAEIGVKRLAEEIKAWVNINLLDNLKIVLPSGTGTTALFLQKNLPFEVLTCACVGGDEYLIKQFSDLTDSISDFPTIMPSSMKYHFGKLYIEFYDIWRELKQETGIEFDLLYDPLAWINLLNLLQHNKAEGATILYIHQGGVLGNPSMENRYLRKKKY